MPFDDASNTEEKQSPEVFFKIGVLELNEYPGAERSKSVPMEIRFYTFDSEHKVQLF